MTAQHDGAGGFVSFVSAGPGDPELLTLKAADRLGRADVVLYDDLASGPVLDLAGPGAPRRTRLWSRPRHTVSGSFVAAPSAAPTLPPG